MKYALTLAMTVNLKVPYDSITGILDQFLPYSINAIDAFSNYRCKVQLYSSIKNDKKSAGVLFMSGYNPHIWFSPTVWIFGNPETNNEILEYMDAIDQEGKYVVQACSEDKQPCKFSSHYKGFLEYMMELNELDFHNYAMEKSPAVRRLDKKDATQSLIISGYGQVKKIDKISIEMEEKFILERETYGIFEEGQLVCRGSIMSCNDKYCSVGGFVTHNDFRNHGLGKSLVSYICAVVISRHKIPVLFMRNDNILASKLYEGIGFKKKGNVYFLDHNTGARP